MESSTNDFIGAFGKDLQTRSYDEILAALDDGIEPVSNDEMIEALGNESYQNFTAFRKARGIDLKDLAKSIDLDPKQVREGVKAGSRFPRTPGAFDAMCRQLGFEPSEARIYLGGIYEARARGKRLDTRMSINEKLQQMHAVLNEIGDPSNLKAAYAAIDGLWDFLNKLADN